MRALAERCGVEVRFDAVVTRVAENGVYYRRGDDDETTFSPADLVVVNADLPYATASLFGDDGDEHVDEYDWDDSFRFGPGVVAFHWALDARIDVLNTHNVFLAASDRDVAERSWRAARSATTDDDDDDAVIEPLNFYVHRPVATDPSAAPEGRDALTVLVPTRPLTRDAATASVGHYAAQFPPARVDAVRTAVLRRLRTVAPDLESSILDEVVDTPADYARAYHVAAGVPFGLSHGFDQLSLTRPGPRHLRGRDNVLFVGASSRPGNGVPLVLVGARKVASEVLSQIRRDRRRR